MVDEPAGAVMAAMKIIEDLMGSAPTIPEEELLAALANEEDRALLRQGFATLIYVFMQQIQYPSAPSLRWSAGSAPWA